MVSSTRTDAATGLAHAQAEKLPVSPASADLLHELQVQQVELETQNETLRQTQLALEESRDLYVDLYEFAPVGYLTLTDAGVIDKANLAVAIMLDLDRKQILQRRFDTFVVPRQREFMQRLFIQMMRHEERVTFDLTLSNSADRSVDVHVSGKRFLPEYQAPCLRLALTDITEFKRTEARLRDSEALRRATMDSIASAIAVLDREGNIVAVNETWRRLAQETSHTPGISVAGAEVGENYFTACQKIIVGLTDEDAMNARNGIQRVIDGHLPSFALEYPCHLPQKQRWFAMSVTPLGPGGRGAVVTHTDITERQLALAELHASEQRLLLAQSAASLGIYDRDIASGKLVCNESIRKIWGFGKEEPVTYLDILAGIHPDDRPAIQKIVDQAFDPRGSGEYQTQYRVVCRTDGTVHHVTANGKVFFAGGRAIRSVGTMQDISNQKRLEQEAQERRREMDLLHGQQVAVQTTAALAHELNQPLIAISNYSEAALRMLIGGSWQPEKMRRALQGAAEQSQRAGRILHDLVNFLREGDVSLQPVDLNALVREVLSMLETSDYRGFRPVIELEHGLSPVLVNRLQIQKVLLNLLQNGIEATRSAGVSTDKITITVKTAERSHLAQVTVRDSGPGLDAEMLHRIYEPFFTTKPKGMGLGLAVSRSLVESNGGQLWVDVEAIPGATFHFTLPFTP